MERYKASEEARSKYQAWQLIERIRGAGYGNNVFQSSPDFLGLTQEEAICKVIDSPEILKDFEKKNVQYATIRAQASTLFNLWKRGVTLDVSAYGPEIEQLFNEKVSNYNAKQA